MNDRLRRCDIHGPELRAYVEALVAAEREPRVAHRTERLVIERDVVRVLEHGEIHDDDDGEWE